MSGTATVEFKGTGIEHFALKPGSFVYVPAGAAHRIVPSETERRAALQADACRSRGRRLVLRQLRCGNLSRGVGYRDDGVPDEIRGDILPLCRRRLAADLSPLRLDPSSTGSRRVSLAGSGERNRGQCARQLRRDQVSLVTMEHGHKTHVIEQPVTTNDILHVPLSEYWRDGSGVRCHRRNSGALQF